MAVQKRASPSAQRRREERPDTAAAQGQAAAGPRRRRKRAVAPPQCDGLPQAVPAVRGRHALGARWLWGVLPATNSSFPRYAPADFVFEAAELVLPGAADAFMASWPWRGPTVLYVCGGTLVEPCHGAGAAPGSDRGQPARQCWCQLWDLLLFVANSLFLLTVTLFFPAPPPRIVCRYFLRGVRQRGHAGHGKRAVWAERPGHGRERWDLR